MNALKTIARSLPGYRQLREKYVAHRLRARGAEEVFTEIYRNNEWHGRDSVSGTGSDDRQTETVVRALPTLFREYAITSVLDIPCGDFYWFRHVDLHGVDYTGADIVRDLIDKNLANHCRDGLRFQHLDLLANELPRVDLILCRDCLVHFSYRDIGRALQNMCASGSTFLLTTTFPGRAANRDIATGQWRVLDLQAAPFRLPEPRVLINEGCTEADGAYRDKSLALWRLDDIATRLTAESPASWSSSAG